MHAYVSASNNRINVSEALVHSYSQSRCHEHYLYMLQVAVSNSNCGMLLNDEHIVKYTLMVVSLQIRGKWQSHIVSLCVALYLLK